jgi:predicted acetyltransferase
MVHVVAGGAEPAGYASYRLRNLDWDAAGLANGVLEIHDLIADGPVARAALWRFCLNVDLVSTVRALSCPLEEPLRWMLAEPRRLRTTRLSDWLWVRLVDVAAALAGRRYTTPGSIVFEVVDGFADQGGRYALEGGPEGADCRPTTADADLVLSAADLGAAYLGGVGFETLRRAGRVEATAGAAARADAMFAIQPGPYCATEF